MTKYARALTIAGSDSGGGAGIQADLKTFTVLNTYGTSVITAVTAQNTRGVTGVYPLSPEQVDAQLDAVLSDIGTDAIKTGMLVNADVVKAVAARLAQYSGVHGASGSRSAPSSQSAPSARSRPSLNLVVDPVMIAKSGDALLEEASVTALREQLLPIATVVTPNVPEATVLTGVEIAKREHMVEAGRRLLEYGVEAALITGGHLPGNDADDVLVTADDIHWFPASRIDTPNTHGTGCTLSAAIAAGLARGLTLLDSVRLAKDYITLAIAKAADIGAGHGPTNHLAWLERAGTDASDSNPVHPKHSTPSLEDRLSLYVIVDGNTPVQLVADLIDAGVGSIQLRDKQLSPGRLVPIARRLQHICRAKGALFFVNDYVEVALAISADGVHIGQDDIPVTEARALLGDEALIGVTVRTAAQAEIAAAGGADYVGFGPVYDTQTKFGLQPLGTERINEIKRLAKLPVVGISGIGAGNAAPVIEAGAAGVAVISAVLNAADPVQAAKLLLKEVRQAQVAEASA